MVAAARRNAASSCDSASIAVCDDNVPDVIAIFQGRYIVPGNAAGTADRRDLAGAVTVSNGAVVFSGNPTHIALSRERDLFHT